MSASSNPVPAPPPAPGPARTERLALCDLMARLGPDAPTMCGDWTTGDLAAHLVIREYRLDAGPGILFRPLGGYTERVRRRVKDSTPFPQMLDRIRQGPPKASLWGLPGMDKAGNSVEYFVHHEDVRRAQPDWQARSLPPDAEEVLWRRLKMARFVLRKVQVEVTLVRPDGKTIRVSKGTRQARVHGPVGELVLWALGRGEVAQVRFTGAADAVQSLAATRWSL
ncbi:TIGR03085 family metal-binding protein [Actinomadura sp. HBU206391]|uniref:TIGR03085 family metal-binding protein n=1 Tax=Actinomadura sp. HBU206391 TaxID=2731692 RepID=UPI002905DEEB|nr:TIGR03085 family metal-binding protein [Actinomadura sp. HBU206391]